MSRLHKGRGVAGAVITATTLAVALVLFMIGLRMMWMATHR